MSNSRLNRAFYMRSDVVMIARELLGKRLSTFIDRKLTSGTIVETEAYAGPDDRASHAFNNRRTARTETMFLRGGQTYVYLCYGIHSLLNVVTNEEDIPHAVLIRAIEPTAGVETMTRRRKNKRGDVLTTGPGCLTQAMGITTRDDRVDLTGDRIWIEETPTPVRPHQVVASARIGVAYAGSDAKRPWRFQMLNNEMD